MKIKIEIETGNSALITGEDVTISSKESQLL